MKPKKSWWVLVIVSIGVMIPFVVPYLTLAPANSRVSLTSNAAIQYPLLLAHILLACIALASGFFQFSSRQRIEKPMIHRVLGRVYVFSVLTSSLLSLLYLFFVDDFTKAISFLVLSILWIFTCLKGVRNAVNKNFEEHRKWMIRSFGVTLVAVSGRLVVPLLLLTYYTLHGFSLPEGREKMLEEVLNVNIWVGLLVNFIVVEWGFLHRKK